MSSKIRITRDKLIALVKESWAISWPMALIMLFEFFMGLTDVFVAGKISKEIQAAYGLAFQLFLAGLIPAIAFTAGTVSVISRLFTASGCKDSVDTLQCTDETALRKAIFSSIAATILMGAIMGLLGFIFSPAVATLLNIPAAIKDSSSQLARIYAIGFIFEFFLINSNGILRSCGKVKVSLRNYACICALNVVLNFLLVFVVKLGFRGIAIATVISVCVGTLLNAYAMRRYLGLRKFSVYHLKEMVRIGWPIGVLQILWNLASLVIFSILARLPRDSIEVIAAYTNGLKVESAIFLPVFAFNMANAVVVGNLLGKGKKDEAYTGGIITAGLGMAITLVMSAVVIFNARNIMLLLSNNAQVIRHGSMYLYISLVFEPIMAWGVILGGGLAGAGYTKQVLAAVALSIWVIRVPLCFFLGIVLGAGPTGIWWALNVSIIVQCAFMCYFYFRKMKPLPQRSPALDEPLA